MYDKNKLCEKIQKIYPDIGQCDIDLNVEYDDKQKSWIVYLKKGERVIRHFLEQEDLDKCMEGKQCVSLGIEIAQFKDYP
ncbi:MAG: hypothetical protein KJO26_09535 [Deltaproteobacteria bacterium]|nr:hypothetical protein [Deltaproteobacteria bacterium]NNL42919.1 hypothetical protein [Desulfobacterales bacterium]